MTNRGFTIIEIVIAIGLMTISAALLMPLVFNIYMSIPYFYEKERAVQEVRRFLLSQVPLVEMKLASSTPVGSLSKQLFSSSSSLQYSFSTDIADWRSAIGSNTCNIDSYNNKPYRVISSYIFPTTFDIADIDVLNGYIYVVGKSSSGQDLYVLNIFDPVHPALVSRARLSPGGLGFSAIHATDHYLFTANKQTRLPLSVIEVKDKNNPKVVYQYTVSTSSNLTTYGFGNAVHFYNKHVYLGLTKSTSSELFVFLFDPSVYPASMPVALGNYETNTQINAIAAKNNSLFIATPEQKQVRILDVSDSLHISEKSFISAPGYAVQDGKALFIVGNTLYIGRTVGGFDNKDNHELFAYNISNESLPVLLFSKNIASSINRMNIDHGRGFLFVGSPNAHLGIYDMSTSSPYESVRFSVYDSEGAIDCEDDVIAIASAHNARIDFLSH